MAVLLILLRRNVAVPSTIPMTSKNDSLFEDNREVSASPTRVPKIVLVTGAAGFIGSHVAEFLLRRGDQVIVLDEVNDSYDRRMKESNLELLRDIGGTKVTIVRGDICNGTLVAHVLEQYQPEFIIHLAARAGVRSSILDPFVYIHSNIEGTTRLLELAVRYKIRNFVMASSSSVYGNSSSLLLDEHQMVDFPLSPYAATKRITELLGNYYQQTWGLPISILRFFTVFGPRGRPDMAPFLFIDSTARGKTISLFSNGSSVRDYTYIDDIVNGVVRALDRPSNLDNTTSWPDPNIFNLGKGDATLLTHFVDLVSKYVGKKSEIQVLPDQPGEVPYTCANVTLAHSILNYIPTVSVEEGIQNTVAWYKQMFPQEHVLKQEPEFSATSTLASSNGIANSKVLIEDQNSDPDTSPRILERNDRNYNKVGHLRGRLDQVRPILPLLINPDRKKVLVVAHQETTSLTEHIVRALLARGDDVAVIIPSASIHEAKLREDFVILTPLEGPRKNDAQLSIHSGCVDNATFLEHVLQVEQPSWIAYLNILSNATESQQDPYTYIRVNIHAFVRLLELVKKRGIQNLVFVSWRNGFTPTKHDKGETEIHSISPYSVTQRGRELFAYTWHMLYHIPMTSVHLSLCGPDDSRLCHMPYDHAPSKQKHSSKQVFSITDAAEGILGALDRPHPYRIIDLGMQIEEEACQTPWSLLSRIWHSLQGLLFGSGSTPRPCAATMTAHALLRQLKHQWHQSTESVEVLLRKPEWSSSWASLLSFVDRDPDQNQQQGKTKNSKFQDRTHDANPRKPSPLTKKSTNSRGGNKALRSADFHFVNLRMDGLQQTAVVIGFVLFWKVMLPWGRPSEKITQKKL